MRKLWNSRSGNFALMTGLLSVPLVLGIGMAVDYSRHLSASKHLQEIADSVSLALAASSERNVDKMVVLAQKIINSNITGTRINTIDPITKDNLTITTDDVDVRLTGNIETSFMGIAGYSVLGVRADSLATRAINGSVEVALVLDNTWSMVETDNSGTSRIDALKSAAGTLVETLMSDANSSVKVSLVPYADYVNVGVENRNKPWVDVPPDIVAVPKVCEKQKIWVTNGCSKWTYDTCWRTVDGVRESYNCNAVCAVARAPYWSTQDVNCKGGVSGQTWYGCVGSRKTGKDRLDDQRPNVPYPGFIGTSARCLNPVIPLTTSKSILKTAVSDMIISRGGYRPLTYIPAGMIWGVNMLSPTEPFSEGAAYDASNKTPRKALVLMTDGENTMRFVPGKGTHTEISKKGEPGYEVYDAKDVGKVNDETLEICDYAKSNKIEIFTVAFMVESTQAKTMLQKCAADADHFFDASDPDALMAAFSGIAQSLQIVRLAR